MEPPAPVTGVKRRRAEDGDAATASRRPRIARVTPDSDRFVPRKPFDASGAFAAHALSGAAVDDAGYLGALRETLLTPRHAAARPFLDFSASPRSRGAAAAAAAARAAGARGRGDRAPSPNLSTRPADILDAPDILDDFYVNTVSWSRRDVVAVGLRDSVYTMDAATKRVAELDAFGSVVTCVAWAPGGRHVAVGTQDARRPRPRAAASRPATFRLA